MGIGVLHIGKDSQGQGTGHQGSAHRGQIVKDKEQGIRDLHIRNILYSPLQGTHQGPAHNGQIVKDKEQAIRDLDIGKRYCSKGTTTSCWKHQIPKEF